MANIYGKEMKKADILRYADQIAVLHEQRIAFFGTPDDCLAQEIPQTCFRIRISGDTKTGYRIIPFPDHRQQPTAPERDP